MPPGRAESLPGMAGDRAVSLAAIAALPKSKDLSACTAEMTSAQPSCGGPQLPQTALAIGTLWGYAAKGPAASCSRPAIWSSESDPFDRHLWQGAICSMQFFLFSFIFFFFPWNVGGFYMEKFVETCEKLHLLSGQRVGEIIWLIIWDSVLKN